MAVESEQQFRLEVQRVAAIAAPLLVAKTFTRLSGVIAILGATFPIFPKKQLR